MIDIQGHKISGFPFLNHSKICDLLEYNGPILSHFRDTQERDYLYLWVDHSLDKNRWLVWYIPKEELINYLQKEISLRDLLHNASTLFATDINADIQHSNTLIITFSSLPEEYIPEPESFFSLDIPKTYFSEINKGFKNYYVPFLRTNGYSFKLENSENQFSEAVKADEAGKMLMDISKSAIEFAEYDFFNKFRENFTDFNSLNTAVKRVKDYISPVVIDTNFHSFEVTLNIDSIMSLDGESVELKSWRKNLFNDYYNSVFDINYASPEALEIVNSRFPEETSRKRILQPILRILKNPNYKLFTKPSNSPFQEQTKISGKRYKEFLPSLAKEELDEEDRKKLVNMIIEVREKDGQLKLGRHDIQDNILFQTEQDAVQLSLLYFEFDGVQVNLRKQIFYSYSIDENNLSKIYCSEFQIEIHENSRSTAQKAFYSAMLTKIIEWKDDDDPRFELYIESLY